MGIILGYLCAVCFLLLAAKWITHRLHLTKVDKFFMRIHKPLSAAMILLCLVHFVVVIPVLQTRSLLVNVSGIVILAAVILLICLCHTIKDREKKMHWHRIFTFIILAGMVVHIVAYYVDFADYQQKIESIEIDNVDLSHVEDGVYEGEYDAGYIYAKVRVHIKDDKIGSVELLEHRNERGKPAEAIIDDVLKEQKIDVDAVSSATNSSKVIKKAIENAVESVAKF